MPSESDKPKDVSPTCWQKTERILLLLTFFCTSIGTVYSVCTAQKALAQATVALRPWIAIPNVNTYVRSTGFDTAFELVNIGQVPAYAQVSVVGDIDGETIPQEERERESLVFVLLPGQKILRDAVKVKDQVFQEMKGARSDHRVFQHILVKYGTQKGDLRYETVKEVELKSADFKQLLSSPERTGHWKLVGEDFK